MHPCASCLTPCDSSVGLFISQASAKALMSNTKEQHRITTVMRQGRTTDLVLRERRMLRGRLASLNSALGAFWAADEHTGYHHTTVRCSLSRDERELHAAGMFYGSTSGTAARPGRTFCLRRSGPYSCPPGEWLLSVRNVVIMLRKLHFE